MTASWLLLAERDKQSEAPPEDTGESLGKGPCALTLLSHSLFASGQWMAGRLHPGITDLWFDSVGASYCLPEDLTDVLGSKLIKNRLERTALKI